MAFLRSMKRLLDRVRDERGAISVLVALGMTVFLGIAALAIDLGHMLNVRTESQRVADLAALAGAAVFMSPPATPTATVQTAKSWALQFAQMNEVNQQPAVAPAVTDGDVVVNLTQQTVRVTVHHSQARGNAVPTIFARVLGIFDVDVVTTAVAQAWPAGGANCIMPFLLPDRYAEWGGDPNRYDGDPPDYYEPYDPSNPSPTATGYTQADKGLQLVIKPSQGNPQTNQPNPSWYYPIALFTTGGDAYRDAIAGCVNPNMIFAIGDVVPTEPGAMIGPTQQGVNALVAQAPTHAWDDTQNCIVDTAALDPTACLGASPRLRPVPMMAPPDAPASGRKDVPIVNWAGVFVEGMQGNDVVVRFHGYSGFQPVPIGGNSNGSLNVVIRLIE